MNETEARKKLNWWPLGAVLLLTALLRLPSLDMPLDRDEGEYATLAWSWMQGLGIPYRDFLEQKPPLAILAYMAAFFAQGFSVSALRLFALFWQLLSVAALYSLALRLSGKRACAALAGGLYACLSVSAFTQGLSANTELFVSLPLILAASILLYGDADGHWLAAGIFIGVAGLAKQTALPAALIFPLLLEGGWRFRLRHLAYCVAGAAAPWLLCLLGFSLAGAASDFWRCVISYNLAYAGQGLKGQLQNLGMALYSLGREDWALWLALAFSLFSAFRRGEWKRGELLGFAWLAAMFFGCTLSGRYYPHYFQTLAAPLSVIVAFWAFGASRRFFRVALPLLFALVFFARNAPLWATADGAARSQRQFGIPNFAVAPRTAEALRTRTLEGSRILIWGAEPEIYFLSRRRPASRFLFHYPFTGEAPAWPGGEDEILKAMEDPATSAVIVCADRDRSDPFQRKFGMILQKEYELHVDLAPDTLIGLRKK